MHLSMHAQRCKVCNAGSIRNDRLRAKMPHMPHAQVYVQTGHSKFAYHALLPIECLSGSQLNWERTVVAFISKHSRHMHHNQLCLQGSKL